jgi:hypothetical protein
MWRLDRVGGRRFYAILAQNFFVESWRYRDGKSLEEEELRGTKGKPLIADQRVKIPPGQSRADRPVASVAIHQVSGGCEAFTARQQAVRDPLRNPFSLPCRRFYRSGRQ